MYKETLKRRYQDSTGGERVEPRKVLIVGEGVPMEPKIEWEHQHPEDFKNLYLIL